MTLPKKLLSLILFGIALTSLFSLQPVQAYTVTLEQVGANVVANGSGALDLTGLNPFGGALGSSNVTPVVGSIFTGSAGETMDGWSGFFGPNSFGGGSTTFATSGSGDLVGIQPLYNALFVIRGYISDTPLLETATYNNATFASLGVSPGTYEWTWGTGLPNQNFTLVIGTVPDGGTTISLLGWALLGLAALRRKLNR